MAEADNRRPEDPDRQAGARDRAESGSEKGLEEEDDGKTSQPAERVQVAESRSPVARTEANSREPEAEALGKEQHEDRVEGAEANPAVESRGGDELKEQALEREQGAVENKASEVGKSVAEDLQHSSPIPSSLPESSPKSVTLVSSSNATIQAQTPSPQKVGTSGMREMSLKKSSELKIVPNSPTVRASASDGYNWRKYGQKQVKSPKGSRSYYKCTYSDCCAKKIECSDQLGHLIEVVNKGMHIHDPPRKNNGVRDNRFLPSTTPVVGDSSKEKPVKLLHDRHPFTPAKEVTAESPAIPEKKRMNSSGSSINGDDEVQDNPIREPEPKRRVKKDNSTGSDLISKPGKKHRFVVHAAGDVGISGDGYRWRKYGQKMVKGNSNPRNYYRCTSAGCPARKHIETAVDNSSAVIITYKGGHDHDRPVPKKRHGPPSAPLVAAASMSNLQSRKGDVAQRQANSAGHCVAASEDEAGGEGMDIGGEKAIESARTLLSIGFEIKQY